jgi:hypothetical protein
MTEGVETFGRTIQLFLVDGAPSGLIIASIHGWTGSVLVASQTTFARLLARPEVDRTGIYILYGPDPEVPLGMRAYIGEADSVRERIDTSAKQRGFWESAIVVTTSEEALNKGHVRYLEARLIEMTKEAGRVKLDNGNGPPSERRRLSEADRANMEAFLANLKVVLPIIGVEILKKRVDVDKQFGTPATEVTFEIRHKSNVKARATESDGEFVVLEGSNALKSTGNQMGNYGGLKASLIEGGILFDDGQLYRFTKSYSFKSPSAAAAVVLDRNSNGRQEWKVVSSKQTYHDWQEQKAKSIELYGTV